MEESQVSLNLEQQFALRSFETQVGQMSESQAKEFLVRLHEQYVMREAVYKNLLKHQWNIGGAA